MASRPLPTYATFDDYTDNQRVAVLVRWFLLAFWLVLHNYRPAVGDITFFINNGLALTLAVLNGFVQWRIRIGRPITRPYVLALGATDLAFITLGIAVSSRFGNNFFILYYPALIGLALVIPSRRVAFAVTSLVAGIYAAMSLLLEPGVEFDLVEERILIIRIATMYAIVGAANLITRIERERRREAVEAESARAEENLQLQIKAQQAERAAELAEANERLKQELEERRRAEQALQRRTNELDAVNKELEAFSYSVSHDLRAPLRSVDGFSQALIEDYGSTLDQEGNEFLQRVRAAGQRMGQLIDDLLDLSRVTRGEMNSETVDITALASSIVAELRQNEPERRVDVVISDGLVAEGDARLLQVALENLMSNAWKYTARNENTRIELGFVEHHSGPAYFVRDDGVGFDMAYADKLFGAFQRLHAASEFDGTGIGLATVQRIVHRHGGRVWAESAVGEGATFYFTLG